MNNWTKPAELQFPSPRAVKMSARFKKTLILMELAMIPPLLIALLMGGGAYYKAERLKDHGIAATGYVTGLAAPANPHAKGATWRVDFTYLPQAASETEPQRQANDGVSPQDFATLELGQAVPIVYDPDISGSVEINLHDRVHTQKAWLFLLVFAPLIFAFVIVYAVILPGYLKQKAVLRDGEATQATILSETDIPYGRGRCTMVTYRFTDSNGMTIEATQKGLPSKRDIENRENFRKYYESIMANPTVVFDPRNSRKNRLYPFGFVECDSR